MLNFNSYILRNRTIRRRYSLSTNRLYLIPAIYLVRDFDGRHEGDAGLDLQAEEEQNAARDSGHENAGEKVSTTKHLNPSHR